MSTLTAPTELGPPADDTHDDRLAPPMTFRATGRLDRAAAGPFVALMASVSEDPGLVVIDVTDVEVSDDAGLRALGRLRDLRDRSDGVVIVRGITAARAEVLRANRLLAA